MSERARGRRRCRLTSRSPIALTESYERHDLHSTVSFAAFEHVMTLIASVYQVPASQVHMDDRFDELALYDPPVPDEERLDLSELVREEAASRGHEVDLSRVFTVRDLVRLYGHLERSVKA